MANDIAERLKRKIEIWRGMGHLEYEANAIVRLLADALAEIERLRGEHAPPPSQASPRSSAGQTDEPQRSR